MMGRVQTPAELVEEFKKSGQFDKLRRDLLRQFQTSSLNDVAVSRATKIARDKIAGEERLNHISRNAAQIELMREIDRYPLVEQAVNEFDYIKSQALSDRIDATLNEILISRPAPVSEKPAFSGDPPRHDGPAKCDDA